MIVRTPAIGTIQKIPGNTILLSINMIIILTGSIIRRNYGVIKKNKAGAITPLL
jgi:hypothetical protein